MMKKDKWMVRSYWKIIGVIIMIYVIIGGMLTPLKPGIEDVYGVISSVRPGEKISLKVTGYNTHFKDAKINISYLKLNENNYLSSNNIEVRDNNHIQIDFEIPEKSENIIGLDPLTLVISNEIDGYALQPNAVSIKWEKITMDTLSKSNSSWQKEMPEVFNSGNFAFPYRNILNETIRNTFFHVALWFAMIILLLAGLFHAVLYLRTKNLRHDRLSSAFNQVGILYGILGLITGAVWAKYTWGTWWTTDVKLNMAAIAMLIYAAYLVIRSSTPDFERRAKLASGYSIFAFTALIPLIFVIPRLYDSLHPGNGGNPALGGEDLDNTLRMFFYPSIIGLILTGVWAATLKYRTEQLENDLYT